LITKIEFAAQKTNDEAGLLILRGDEKSFVKLYSSVNGSGQKTIYFCFDNNKYEVLNTVGNIVWLKVTRTNHIVKGYFSNDGNDWIQVGQSFDISSIDLYSDYVTFTGTRQGLYVQNTLAYFDFYIYRDAFSPILAECPANQYGTTVSSKQNGISSLDNIGDSDWALYASVEFGNDNEYVKSADSVAIIASCASAGGVVEVWLDSLDSNSKIAECNISNTGSWVTYKTFTSNLLMPVLGRHDVYLRFKGTGTGKLFMLQWLTFIDKDNPTTSVNDQRTGQLQEKFLLNQNYPNPFNPTTIISFTLPAKSFVTLKVFDSLGREVSTLVSNELSPGTYSKQWNAQGLSSGTYFARLQTKTFVETKKLVLLK
jgi:hypothetical protein